ncbi:hypothetical protein, partial [Dialister hominis]|uniref:hypothetical protein n=1 Tax=Dialister hominis TaxID=2582419 RepID=UPI003FEF3680
KKYQKIKIGACSCVAGLLLLPEQGKRQFFPPWGAASQGIRKRVQFLFVLDLLYPIPYALPRLGRRV